MKKTQVASEKMSAGFQIEKNTGTLVPPVANRLRKNLCQALSSSVQNGLHYEPLPSGAIFLMQKHVS